MATLTQRGHKHNDKAGKHGYAVANSAKESRREWGERESQRDFYIFLTINPTCESRAPQWDLPAAAQRPWRQTANPPPPSHPPVPDAAPPVHDKVFHFLNCIKKVI